MNKFGDDCGEKVWNAVNDCFDAMPMAATVDGKVRNTVCFLENVLTFWALAGAVG